MSSARTDLCGGRSAMIVPTATRSSLERMPSKLADGIVKKYPEHLGHKMFELDLR